MKQNINDDSRHQDLNRTRDTKNTNHELESVNRGEEMYALMNIMNSYFTSVLFRSLTFKRRHNFSFIFKH
jgi:hypothetical protein